MSKYVQTFNRHDHTVDITKQPLREYISNEKLQRQIQDVSLKVASELEEESDIPLSELALKIAINDQQVIILLDVDPNRPDIIYDAYPLANALISYAQSLIALESNK